LKVKEVQVGEHRYIVCLNPEQARYDALSREAIVASLEHKLRQGDKALVGNRGYRKYLRSDVEARYDGKWVLRTSTSLEAEEVALKYKQLWRVEQMIRSVKSLLETRPVYHRHDATIRGHVFCSFLALVLRQELEDRLQSAGWDFEWGDVIQDLDTLEEVRVSEGEKQFLLRTATQGVAGKVFQAVGVALPPTG